MVKFLTEDAAVNMKMQSKHLSMEANRIEKEAEKLSKRIIFVVLHSDDKV